MGFAVRFSTFVTVTVENHGQNTFLLQKIIVKNEVIKFVFYLSNK